MGVQANKGTVGLYRGGGIGDNLIAAAVLPGLKKRYGLVEVMSLEPQSVVFENNPFVDKLSVHKRDVIKPDAALDWSYLRAKEFEAYFNLSHTCEATLAFFPAQYQFQWSSRMRRKAAGKSYLEMAADVCDVPYDELRPDFYPTNEELEAAAKTKAEVGGRFAAWVLSGTRIDKCHPLSPFAVARIIREVGIPVVMIGAPGKDRDMAINIHDDVVKINGSSEGLHLCLSPDLVNETWPIRRVLTLCQQADIVIGPDTGPMWAVSMHKMPKLALLSHASPENITKYWKNTTTLHADHERVPCHPCHQLHDVMLTCMPNKANDGAACISDISVETIVRATRAALHGSGAVKEAIAQPLTNEGLARAIGAAETIPVPSEPEREQPQPASSLYRHDITLSAMEFAPVGPGNGDGRNPHHTQGQLDAS